jgi:hypothetical protein
MPGKNFPDLTGDGKVTQADVLKGRGVKGMMRGGKVNGMMRGGPVKMMRGGEVEYEGEIKPKARPKDLERAAKKKRMDEEKRTKKRIIKEATRRRTRDHDTEPKQDIKSALGFANGGCVSVKTNQNPHMS